ncbi:hypothetical protein LSTR_LSTR014854 [Laodelphax striatellus]|uniref:Uncharacterized protein n=1 Tax=Laodelphax striatellus TaxID=195883 RepID=A0A482XDW6_LAOST|nr:hypothetical protein LSTR_LSTR014854 [Laodelphax striatellus]
MGDESEDNKPSQVPPVPPQTYRWEEVRKQKLQGAYPWTHLFKPPFDNATWEKERRIAVVFKIDVGVELKIALPH